MCESREIEHRKRQRQTDSFHTNTLKIQKLTFISTALFILGKLLKPSLSFLIYIMRVGPDMYNCFKLQHSMSLSVSQQVLLPFHS